MDASSTSHGSDEPFALRSNGDGRTPERQRVATTVADRLGLVGSSPPHRDALARLARVAPTGVEVLISGPSGVGKELYAKFAHGCSRRAGKEFVAVNCGAVPEGLFENELFGHAHGAFTGADRNVEGLVAAAEGGTLFLDEVDALTPGAQVKLLRFLQQREYRRLGEARVRRANVSVVAATNADLARQVGERRFREDLFFRLRVVAVDVPPLRERAADDVPPLLAAFVRRAAAEYALPPVTFTPRAAERLLRYGWPGNVRELENLVRSLTCQQLDRPADLADLPLLDDGQWWAASTDAPIGDTRNPASQLTPTAGEGPRSFQVAKHQAVNEFERQFIERALRQADGNIAAAARVAGKHRRAFFELMRKHGVCAIDMKRLAPAGEHRGRVNGEVAHEAADATSHVPCERADPG